MTFSIRKLSEDDWQLFSEIRLRALQTDPNVFGSSFERESQNTESEWRKCLNDPDAAVFAVFEDDRPVGMTGVAIDRNDPTRKTAILWGSWLEPSARKKGLSKILYEARLEWAKAHSEVERVIVSHRESNFTSKLANKKFAFIETHTTEKVWNDGTTDKEHHYELKLPPKH